MNMNSSENEEWDIYFSFESNSDAIGEIIELLSNNNKLGIKICLAHSLKSIKSSKIILAFITSSYSKDTNCMSELRYAQQLHKKVLLYTPDAEVIGKSLTTEFAYLSEIIFVSDKLKLLKAIATNLHRIDTQTHAIGIDFGAATCCVATYINNRLQTITNELGENTTDSYVAFTQENGIQFGKKAKNQFYRNWLNTIKNFKNLLKKNEKIAVEYQGEIRQFCAEEITAMMFSKLKESAEVQIGGIVADAVITVPCQMSQIEFKAVRNAAEAAGLHVLRIISDTSAASFALEFNNRIDESLALIFDMGAVSLSVSLVLFDKGIIEVKSSASDFGVGGEFFDEALVQFFSAEIRTKLGIDVSTNKKALVRLTSACERLKCTLSSLTKGFIEIYAIEDDIDFYSSISREKFEEISEGLMERVLNAVKNVLKDAGVDREMVNDVVLVGGCSRIPMIQKVLSEFFKGVSLNKSLNADEAVACGAAVQAAILRGVTEPPMQDLLLLDVMPRSIGVEGAEGLMQVLVGRNTTIPVKQKGVLRVGKGCKGLVVIRFYEGEEDFVRDNLFLGEIEMSCGDAGLVVTLDVDANLEIFVVVEDLVSRKRVSRNLTATAEIRPYEQCGDECLPVLSVMQLDN